MAAEHLTALYAQQDSLDAALEEAFAEVKSGHGQPFDAFAADLRARSHAHLTPSGAA